MFKFLSKILSFAAVSVIVLLPVFSPWLSTKQSTPTHKLGLAKSRQSISWQFEHFSIGDSWHFIKNRQLIPPPAKFKSKLLPAVLKFCCGSLDAFELSYLEYTKVTPDYTVMDSRPQRLYLSIRKLLI